VPDWYLKASCSSAVTRNTHAPGQVRRYTPLVPLDTTPSADARYHEILRAQAPAARLAQAAALTRAVRQLAEAGIRQRHPAASDTEVRVRLAARLYGRKVAARLFGSVPHDAV